ncbi:MAG: ribonuclease HI [Planctomycetota bacterium]|jgi:ribonuclease HI
MDSLFADTDTRPDPDSLPIVELFTDGACLGNPGPGGWAFILRDSESRDETEGAGGEPSTTNNRMELMAVIRGLESLTRPHTVMLCADSQYVLNGISQWMAGWKARGWRKADKRPVLNDDLWKRLDELKQTHRIDTAWTRGHAGHDENERCDAMASQQAELQKQGRD